jgi:hypothetical protein
MVLEDTTCRGEEESKDGTLAQTEPKASSISGKTSEAKEWHGAADPDNPLNWSSKRKWSIIGLISAITYILYDLSFPGDPQS